ncbi:cytochrome P450 [Xylariaceae sp. FL1272]|nr:cytochrome P450 [Xylariaceae sp. FL1272]
MQFAKNKFAKFLGQPFVVRRHGVDITILPHRYLSELRLATADQLSSVRVMAKNMTHEYTKSTFLMHSDLHFRAVQNKMTPELPLYIEKAIEEINYGHVLEVPKVGEWVEMDVQSAVRMLVARITSVIMIGPEKGRDPDWLRLIVEFPGSLLGVAYTLRWFPPWMRRFVAPCLPARRTLNMKYKAAYDFLLPLIERHRAVKGSYDPDERIYEEEDDDTLLSWMIRHGNAEETKAEEMSARQILLTLASIHTTSMTVTNILYDLCEHRKWIPVLRQEISQVTRQFGALDTDCTTCKPLQWLQKLEKMNSFMVETLRFRPPLLLSPQREAMQPIVLQDGLRIPKGSRISWASWDHLNSNHITPNPQVFDPMRSYRKRQQGGPGEKTRHLAGQTDINNLTFGYGKLACPGRAFAIAEVQVILVRLLNEFDFRFCDEGGRPRDMFADEQMYPDPRAKLTVRRRKSPDEHCNY